MRDDDPELRLIPVGVAHTPYESPDDAPHQGFADDTEATIEIYEEFARELDGIEDSHRLTIVYWAHEADRESFVGSGDPAPADEETADAGPAGEETADAEPANEGTPDGDCDGAFAGRGPDRPNPLAICTCMVLWVDGRRIRVRGLDAVDGSPIVDVKPALQAER